LDDIELGRLPPESLLLKIRRLARLTGDQGINAWLSFELAGYVADDPVAAKYMDATGRWTDRARGQGYWQSLPEIDAHIRASKLQMAQLRVPDVSIAPATVHPHELATGWGGAPILRRLPEPSRKP
jgi:AbiTii